jgi:colicin import membrane protein
VRGFMLIIIAGVTVAMLNKSLKKYVYLLVSVLIHCVLLASIFLLFTNSEQYRMPGQVASKPIINVNTVDENKWNAKKKAERLEQQRLANLRKQRIAERKAEQLRKVAEIRKAAELRKAEQLRLQQVKVREQQKKLAVAKAKQKQRRLAVEKAKKLAALKAKRKAAKQAKEKLAQQKKAQQSAAMQKLEQKTKTISKSLFSEQMQSEEKKMAQRQHVQQLEARRNKGIIDRYKASIINAINDNWQFSVKLSRVNCQVLVRLAPDGAVLSAKLLSSSGNVAFDQSAIQAILRASPLPVPKDTHIFNRNFRVLSLTMNPNMGLLAYN